MTEHPQVHLQVGRREADVDEGIAPLIAELWKAGIDTVLSCQENRPGVIWIAFMTTRDARRFLNIVARYRPASNCLYNRAYPRWVDDTTRFWEYNVFPIDWNLDEEVDEEEGTIESHVGASAFDFEISVRIPDTDYPVVLRRMIAYNEHRKALSPGKNTPGPVVTPAAVSPTH